ncbi:MAG: hypothetical protein J0L71_20395 [Candidatus Accumulibacter sp.]|uniref:hypothetical protein n=1 Tax=Accumulibacter sp. TaxID=2053492 RepID=UPI001AC75FD6|nr:hypothetical protein [Accumulibacter sp.]MBN8520153.1 hypothetical protein [Accumulibacter sp.]
MADAYQEQTDSDHPGAVLEAHDDPDACETQEQKEWQTVAQGQPGMNGKAAEGKGGEPQEGCGFGNYSGRLARLMLLIRHGRTSRP